LGAQLLKDLKLKTDDAIEEAIAWLLKMQIESGSFKGGFLRGLNFGWFPSVAPLIYTEITGYGLKTLVNFLNEGKSDFEARAKAAAGFLLKVQSDEGPFSHGAYCEQKKPVDTYYTFDTAICTSALLDFYRIGRGNNFFQSSKRAGYWLVKVAQNDDGSFMSKYEGGKFVRENRWYGDRCCLHGKNVIALLKLWENTSESLFKSSAEKAANWVMTLQLENGAFKVNSTENYTFAHAHCYVIEGLLYAYHVTRQKDYLLSALKAAKWLIDVQKKSGGLYESYGDFSLTKRMKNGLFPIRMERIDVVAQAIRIWAALYSLTADESFLDSACKATDFLLKAQFKKENPNFNGGFYQQMNSLLKLPIMRTWSCIFSIQALLILKHLSNFDQIMQELM